MRAKGRDLEFAAAVWAVIYTLFVVFVALTLLGCATGLPGSPVRAFYNLCMRDTQDATYCEAWANSRGLGGQVGMQMIVPFPGR